MRKAFTLRVRFIALVLLFVACVLITRLFFVQIVHGEEYRERAENQYSYVSGNQFDRGSIFFTTTNGQKISAATLASGFIVAIVPREIDDPEGLYESLRTVLSIERERFLSRARLVDDPYEEIARRVPYEVVEQISEMKLKGVRIHRERWRVYPGGSMASHTIGFLGYGNDGVSFEGRYGLERSYDEVLVKENTGLYVNFFADLFTNIETHFFKNEKAGGDVVISIEPTVQGFTERILDEYGARWSPDQSGAIILDPQTGQIISFAARPHFDPNDLRGASVETFSHPLVEYVFEFGSIVKPLTIAAALDAGAVTPETTYTDQGFAVYDGARISNFDGKARGTVKMQEVLSQSLNTGVAFAVEEMGVDRFREYMTRFGLREKTGIELPHEAAPITDNLDSPRMIEYVTASFGQGIAVSPIAMARSLGVLANGGVLPHPHLVTRIEYPGADITVLDPEGRRVISEESASEVTKMLVSVVDTALKDGAARIPEMSIAAKTGTAEIAQRTGRGYYEDRYLHSFFGYFPAYEPRFLIFFYSVYPKGARYSSETWTQPFSETVRFLINYYRVPPDRAEMQ